MTKKDYIIITKNVNSIVTECKKYKDSDSIQTVEHLCRVLCVDFFRDNSRFDSERFLSSCGF